jgi:uncharacterized protein (TIGR04255 family)
LDGAHIRERHATKSGLAASPGPQTLFMARQRHLNHAPLVEALLDIRVAPNPKTTLEQLSAIDSRLAPRYARKGEKRRAGVHVHFDRDLGASAKASMSPEGFVFQDIEGKRIVQVTLDGFTQNLLKPYSDFDALIKEAKTNWDAFVDVARPQQITRIALRYINDLRLPASKEMRFENFMPFAPQIPPNLSQMTSDFATNANFASRIAIEDDELNARVIVAQLFQGVVDSDGVQVILDIDAICDDELKVGDPRLWERFKALRKLKNDVFFSYTTDPLLEQYE